ncbi:MAG: hypothetical protein R3E58_13635 [Phycisphaerae bacterium]
MGPKTNVLTDSQPFTSCVGRGKLKSRNKRVHQRECLGMYMQKWKGEPAWIRLVVDNVLAEIPWYAKRIPIVRDAALGSVLYHEFGHHIHKTKKPEFKEKEDVADKWSDKLLVAYLRKQYWYFRPILMPIAYTFKLARKCLRDSCHQAVTNWCDPLLTVLNLLITAGNASVLRMNQPLDDRNLTVAEVFESLRLRKKCWSSTAKSNQSS